MNRILLIVFLLTSTFQLAGQSINLSRAPLSSGDQKKDFVALGNTSTQKLVLIDTQGKIWIYEGSNLDLWSNKTINNTDFFQSIFLQDSVLFIRTEDAFLTYKSSDEKPTLFRKPLSANHPIRTVSKNYITDKVGEYFYHQSDRIIWKRPDISKPLAELLMSNHSLPVVDYWNTKWILYDKKLYYLFQDRLRIIPDAWKMDSENPTKIFVFEGKWVSIYANGKIRIRFPEFNEDVIYPYESKIVQVLLDNTGQIWLIDEELRLSVLKKNKQIISWPQSITGVSEIPTSVGIDNDILSIVQANEGIVQAKIAIVKEDYIWLPHRLNRTLKKEHIISALQDDLLYLFTQKYGVKTLNNREMGLIKSPRLDWEISHVVHQQYFSIILDRGKRWFYFDRNDKKITQITSDTLPPEIQSDNFLIHDGNIYYKSGYNLVALNISSGSWYKQECPIPFIHPFFVDNSLREYEQDALRVYYLKNKAEAADVPILHTVILETQQGIKHTIFPQTTEGTINLETKDYPISFWAKASYLKNPKSIEYAWQWNGGDKYDKDFNFNPKASLRTKYIGTINPTITLSNGENSEIYVLRSLNTIKSIDKSSNTWAIYLSILLGSVLLLTLLGNNVRSRRQKRKIAQLQAAQRMSEMEQKALQLQMNPHFIFNALNGVKGMIAMGDSKKARQYLTKVSGWMRNMLNDARSTSVQVSQEIENLEMYLQIEQELRGNSWEFEIVENEVNNNLFIPPMMIQPFVENAIVHAFNDGRKGKITLRFQQKGRRLIVEVEDNGTGRKDHKKEHSSVALKLIQDRLRYLDDGTSMEQFVMIDKSMEDHGETGLLVRIVLPLSQTIQ